MIRRISAVLIALLMIFMEAGCSMSTLGPDEGGNGKPEPSYERWVPSEYSGWYHGEMETAASGTQHWFMEFGGDGFRTLSFIETDMMSGRKYMIESADSEFGTEFQFRTAEGIAEIPDAYEFRPRWVIISQRMSEHDVETAVLSAAGNDGWKIDAEDSMTSEIYKPEHEWTETEKAQLFTESELAALAESFISRVDMLAPGYMRLQPAENGFTCDLTYAEEISGSPSSLMTGVKDGMWEESSNTECYEYF